MDLAKIYGIEFNKSVPKVGKKRIFDADIMNNDYVAGDRFQLNGDRPVDPQQEWRFVIGGGYDHSLFGSLFTYRGFISDTVAEWIYSNRVCLRR